MKQKLSGIFFGLVISAIGGVMLQYGKDFMRYTDILIFEFVYLIVMAVLVICGLAITIVSPFVEED